MRLDRYLHDLGIAARKDLAAAIRRGAVEVDGVVERRPNAQVSTDSQVSYGGQMLTYRAKHYLMLHKPGEIITATTDAREKTVLDLLPASVQRLKVAPVGRLDRDTTGLLLFTNDGALAHKLLSPKRHVSKIYAVTYSGTLPADAETQVAEGLELSDFTTAPALLRRCGTQQLELTITEGKFHQVKRMMHALGCEVESLTRIAFGPLQLPEDLAPGQWRYLSAEEEAALLDTASS